MSLSTQKPKPKPKATGKAAPSLPRPSSSVILISPTNQVLLLHRVQTSTSFPSAHVFPGGNVSAFHDGLVPDPQDSGRHVDGKAYRMAAIRETFEESGILLAKTSSGRLLEVAESERESARKAIHKGDVPFPEWLSNKGGTPDIESLIPFTRWITPAGVPKRYTTQMYIYFLPVSSPQNTSIGTLPTTTEAVIPLPTHDGGVEHTAACFLPASSWLSMARSGEIILFPPQFFLLYQISQFLTQAPLATLSPNILEQQRVQLRNYMAEGDPLWTEVCISPTVIDRPRADRRIALSLEQPGPEVVHLGRRGLKEYVVLLGRGKTGAPANLDIRLRKDILEEEWKASL